MNETPGWLKGLIIVFGCTTVLTFGLFLYRHAEDAAVYERYRDLVSERDRLNLYVARLRPQVQPLEQAIGVRRQKIAAIAATESQSREDITRIVAEGGVARAGIEAAVQAESKKYDQLLTDARARRLELHQEEDRALALERDLDERRLRTREQLQILSRELEQLKREARNQNKDLDSRIDELTERITQLTEQRELNNRELRSDGQVLAARATDGYLVIDRGHQHGLRMGTKFTVFNRRGGRHVIKGQIEVVEIDSRTAVSRVLEEVDSNDPLIPGDHIHNPVYNPAETKIFVLAGDFTRFSKEELARFIVDAGGRVDHELSTATDYLVAGGRADAALAQASKLGISILSEGQALELVRYSPKFLIAEGMTAVLRGKFNQVSAGRIESFIEKSGGQITGRLDSNAQVLIAGEGAEEDIATARSLGLIIVDQSQFSHLND